MNSNASSDTYVVPLGDAEVPEKYHEDTVKWRKYAVALGYTGPVVWKVRKGFTLKSHAPLAGPCYKQLVYIQNWDIENDETTKDSFVFWAPRLAKGSTNKTIFQMKELRAEIRQNYNLPANHATSFGSISLLFALILAHFKRAGERVPLKHCYAASDSFYSVDFFLFAGGFGESGLDCDYWGVSDGDRVGFFLLGEELGI